MNGYFDLGDCDYLLYKTENGAHIGDLFISVSSGVISSQ